VYQYLLYYRNGGGGGSSSEIAAARRHRRRNAAAAQRRETAAFDPASIRRNEAEEILVSAEAAEAGYVAKLLYGQYGQRSEMTTDSLTLRLRLLPLSAALKHQHRASTPLLPARCSSSLIDGSMAEPASLKLYHSLTGIWASKCNVV